jgi:hypothetical protein
MTMDETIDAFMRLFIGRGDVYGAWVGGAVKEPLTRDHYVKHLTTGPYIGVYCFTPHGVPWGCVDIDGKDFPIHRPCPYCASEAEHECYHNGHTYGPHVVWDWTTMWAIARNLQTVLSVKGIPVHLERTQNGIHCWVWPDEPLVAAATMRRALMAACTAIGYSPKEVNPKQEEAKGRGFGNYVRLPYYGNMNRIGRQEDRYFVDSSDEPLTLVDFIDSHTRAPKAALESVASLWTPPQRTTVVDVDAGLNIKNILPMLGGKAYRIWEQGPLAGSDRSTTLARLAYTLAEDGITASAAFAVVKSADERWGKFHDRDDCDEQLAKFIERAYP